MAENLPEPESRKEAYLAKAAGVSVEELPIPASREELYLNAIANGGGGGGTSDFEDLTNRPKYNGATMTGSTDIPLSPTVVQTTGTSTTNVMSQNATTSMIFADPETTSQQIIKIGRLATTSVTPHPTASSIVIGNASAVGTDSIAIGTETTSTYASKASFGGVAIGTNANAGQANNQIAIGNTAYNGFGERSIAIGVNATANAKNSISFGGDSCATSQGEMNIGLPNKSTGYNNSAYRLLTGLYDPQSAHDAATKGYVDGLVGNIESALNTINNGGGN